MFLFFLGGLSSKIQVNKPLRLGDMDDQGPQVLLLKVRFCCSFISFDLVVQKNQTLWRPKVHFTEDVH